MSHTLFLIALANFLAAFGGGGLLSKGLSSLAAVPHFPSDSIFAYLLGSSLSLGVILGFRKRIEKAGAFLSLGGAGLAVFLWFHARGGVTTLPGALILFTGLCLVFTCIFVPRTSRVDLAAQRSNQLAWVEFAYGAGYLVSLIAWRFFPGASLSASFAVCAGSLGLCSALDFWVARRLSVGKVAAATAEPEASQKPAFFLFSGVALLSLSTIAVQIAMQRLSSLSGDSLPLIAFDAGILLAPLLALGLKISTTAGDQGVASARLLQRGRAAGMPTLGGLVASLLLGMAVCLFVAANHGVGSPLLFVAFSVVSYLYELAAILLFEAVAKVANKKGSVAMAFGIMGVSATAVYGLLLYRGVGILPMAWFAAVSSVAVIVIQLAEKPNSSRSS